MTPAPLQEPALDGSTPLRVGVVAPRRRLAWVRVLHESLAQHHPAATLTALVLDGVSEGEPFAQVTPDDVMSDSARWHRLAMLLRSEELARALAPSLALHLLGAGEPILLLADDVLVRGPLDDLARLTKEHGAVLVPRRHSALPEDDRRPDAADLAKLGVFDDGIVGMSGEGALVRWWARAVVESWLDGRDEAPLLDHAAQFPHAVVNDPAHGCARWNLDEPERRASDARTLRLAEFDPAQPHLLVARAGEAPRVLVSEHPGLAVICQEHADRLERLGDGVTGKLPYGLDRLACGLPRDNVVQAVYRDALIFGAGRGDPAPPDPFALDDGDAFLAWLAAPVIRAADSFDVSRYLYEIYRSRGDLQVLFPHLREAAGPLVEWGYGYGRRELHVPLEVLPPRSPSVPTPASGPELGHEGVNVAGYFRSEFGIGEAARLLVDGLDAAGVPHVTTTYTRAPIRHGHSFDDRGGGHPYATNIVCVNVDRLEQFGYDAGPEFFHGRYTIGYWWWEAGILPEPLRPALDIVDEVWVGSDYVRSLIAPVTGKPVVAMPVPIHVPSLPDIPRAELGLPEGFLFYFMFDFFSSIERKNPLGLIKAYCAAFGPDDGAVLVLKSVNGETRIDELEMLRAAAGGRRDIVLIDRYVSAAERGGMMAACDCYVSLHRSEGLGLTMAEAMAIGKPVVATGWSGNLEFMSDDTSYLVRYDMTTLEHAHGPYPAGAEWAEPDLDHAAQLMRQVFDDRPAAAAVGERARRSIVDDHGTEPTAEFVRQRLDAIAAEAPERAAAAEAAAEAARPRPPAATRAYEWFRKGMTESWAHDSRFGSAGAKARSAMLAAIKPYTSRQSELDGMLVEAALDSHKIGEDLAQRVASLEEKLVDVQESAEGVSRSVEELDERAAKLERATRAADTEHARERP